MYFFVSFISDLIFDFSFIYDIIIYEKYQIHVDSDTILRNQKKRSCQNVYF